MGGGLVAAAATTYGFQAVAARALGPAGYAPVAVLWSVLFLVVPATWGPVEQEAGRRLVARREAGEGGRPVVVAAGRALGALAAPTLVALVALVVLGADAVLSDRTGVGVALVVAVAAFAPNHLTRAALAARGAFGRYGLCIALDSAVRLALAVALAAGGVEDPVPYAAAVAVAPLVPVVAFRRALVDPAPGPPAGSLLPAVAPLVAGQALAQVLVNGGPVAVAALAVDGEEAVAGAFLAALLVARIPLFFFQAVQSSLLPRLAALAARGDHAGFRTQVSRLLGLVAGLGVVAVVAAAVVGPTAVRVGFGDAYVLPGRDLAVLALAASATMAGFVLAAAVVAVEGHRRVAPAWAAGVVAAAAVVAVGDDLVWRVSAALAVGGLVATAAHGVALAASLRPGVPVPGRTG